MSLHGSLEVSAAFDPAMTTRLYGRRLVIVQVIWIALVTLILGLFFISVPIRFDELLNLGTFPAEHRVEYASALQRLGLSPTFYAGYTLILGIALALGSFAMAALIAWRKPDDWMALFVSFTLVLTGATFGFVMHGFGWKDPAWYLPVNFLFDLGRICFISFFYLFPDGRFIPRWTHWLTVILATWTLAWTFFPTAPFSPFVWPPLLWFLVRMGWFGTGLFAQFYRHTQVSSPMQHQQNKWVLFGLVADLLVFFGFGLFRFIFPTLAQPNPRELLFELAWSSATTLSLLFVPLTIGIAVLRYRLWDIDVIINRTLVYGILTGMLALIYLSSVLLLEYFFHALSGQSSQLAVVVSTLGMAALFSPLRRRIQENIDRRFYRRKYDTAQVLLAFSATIRDEVDLDKLTDQLLTVVEETMQPAHLSLWLRE